ncbi:MAG: hypothetical protein E7345_00275 [Clostridiales bacterium]|nr:hypothetical protein [Clostridiales bacterium]
MKKKRAIRDYVLISLFIVIIAILSFISFPVVGTNYDFKGLANIHLGLELGGGVKNTYELEVADWYKGDKSDAYQDAIDRVQKVLNKYYADATVYFSGDDKMTIEVPDVSISDALLVNHFEIKTDKTEEAEARIVGSDIEKATYTSNGTTYGVLIQFTDTGAEKFKELTKEVSGTEGGGSIYICWGKDYENATSLSISSEIDYIFLQGEGISTKAGGEAYAMRLESSKIGVNMFTDLDDIEVSARYGSFSKWAIWISSMAIIVLSIALLFIMFKELGLVSALSLLFSLMFTVIVCAIFDLQVTFGGWLGFMFGYILNFLLHMYYLNVIKNEYAMGKKFTIAFTSGYKKALFNMLDVLLITLGVTLLMLVVPSSAVKMFVYHMLMTLAGTAFTSLYLNKVVCVDYTGFNVRNEKKVNFVRGENVDEI